MLREKLYKKAAFSGYTFPNLIHPKVYVSPRAIFSNGVIILNNAVLQNNATVGSEDFLTLESGRLL